MMQRDDYGILILTHGRPDSVLTTGALERYGYTGPIKYVVDNEDATVDRYRANFGADNVIVFDKKAVGKTFDEGDNFDDRRTITYARNAAFDVAKGLGWKYFIEMDDDYSGFFWKFHPDLTFKQEPCRNLDGVFDALVGFLESCPNVSAIAMAQGGDYAGGGASGVAKNINIGGKFRRKCMNSFIMATDRPVGFVNRMNEDVCTYTWRGSTGGLFFTTNMIMLSQRETQAAPGGITELYKRYGTYTKSFNSVMRMPSSVKVSALISAHPRIHHNIRWRYTVPAILEERFKK